MLIFQKQYPDCLCVSAKTGKGIDNLIERVSQLAQGELREVTLKLDMADGKVIHFLESRATVLDRRYDGDEVHYTVRLGTRQFDQLRAMGVSQ